MIKPLLSLIMVFASLGLYAQEQANPADSTKTRIKPLNPTSVGVHIGSQGFGLNVGYQINTQFGVRLSGSYAPVGFTQTRAWANRSYDMDFDAEFGNVQLQGIWFPFHEAKSTFAKKVTVNAGVAYFFKSEAKVVATPKDGITYGEIVVDRSAVGLLTAKSTWPSFAPYAGLGLHKLNISDKLHFNVDLGSYYLGSPKVVVEATNLLASNTSQQSVIEENLRDYRWLPVLQLGFAYQF